MTYYASINSEDMGRWVVIIRDASGKRVADRSFSEFDTAYRWSRNVENGTIKIA